MFEGTERVTAAPALSDNKAEVSLKLKMVHELKLYVQSPSMRLRGNDKEFLCPLGWWERMETRKQFPVLCRLANMFLACPAASAPSKGAWS